MQEDMDRTEIDEDLATPDSPVKGFMRLPRELRNVVYSYAVVARPKNEGSQPRLALRLQRRVEQHRNKPFRTIFKKDPIILLDFTTRSPNINVSLLCTSRQIKVEAEDVFYKENAFTMDPCFRSLPLLGRRPHFYGIVECHYLRRAIPTYASDQLTTLHCERLLDIKGSWVTDTATIDLSDETAILQAGIRLELGLLLPPNTSSAQVINHDGEQPIVDRLLLCDTTICRLAALPKLRRLVMNYDFLISPDVFGRNNTDVIHAILGRIRDAFSMRKTRALPDVDVHMCGATLDLLNDAHKWKHWSLLGCTNSKCLGSGDRISAVSYTDE